MPGAVERLHRMLALQRQLHRIEEWKLADLDQTLEALAASQDGLIRALNEDDALQGLFIDATARRLRALSEEAARVETERTAQLARLIEHAARKACAERLVEAADGQAESAANKKQLLDAIDRLPAAQASRKIVEG
jgi:hypothetical protein